MSARVRSTDTAARARQDERRVMLDQVPRLHASPSSQAKPRQVIERRGNSARQRPGSMSSSRSGNAHRHRELGARRTTR
jgi:hypothetical protein